MGHPDEITAFIAHWRDTGGSELANTQSFINGLCALIGVPQPHGSKADDAGNDYVFERRVFQDNGDGTQSFGRIDCYRRDSFILEAKQGSDADRAAADRGDADLDLFGQTATARMKRGTARRGTPGWAKAKRDEHGKSVTRWGGETMKAHPATGRMVPDEDARVDVFRPTPRYRHAHQRALAG